ncbi:arylsulfatase [Phenylobacterium ferrooxidans]|uniref:Arylsulfatase n=1 Tax=Phenylobacterium ferrooxidans TaxID=2982689 RepID=A0ABW6CVR6_9CAUL
MATKTGSDEAFGGVIGRTIAESQPWWPPAKGQPGRPDIVLVVLDDTGFAHLGCYGSTLKTPHIDALAAGGLRYSGFHTTALCSPTRACILTGRNPHSVGMRGVSNWDTGFPNMRGAIPRSAATVAQVLNEDGYATFAVGKWHLAPMAECSAAGPFQNWPLQKGFDRFYGFMQGETDHFHPELTCDNRMIDAPATAEDGYHLSEDLVDQAAAMVRDLTSLVPERPYFLYLPFGAMHSPHHAPQAYLDRWRGGFDEGWDVARERWFANQKAMGIVPADTLLAPHNPGVKPWASLSPDQQTFAARLQEAFAAMLEHTDDQIGRLVAELKALGRWDNTLLIVMSDNGASQEGGPLGVLDEMLYFNGMPQDVGAAIARLDDIGGPNSHSNIPWGWAQAGNTPLKWYKQNTHGGGVRDPLVIHWPGRLPDPGAVREQFCHAIDIAPTILAAAGLEPPEVCQGVSQMPMHGVSLVPSFAQAAAILPRTAQYFEMLGHRGIWKDGWKAVTHHTPGVAFDADTWELYHLDTDFSECRDLAQAEPERLKALIDLWWSEAEDHGALPLDDRNGAALFRASMRQGTPSARNRFVYYPPLSHLVADSCPPVARGWKTVIDLTHPTTGGDGALVARGSINSGFALYIQGGKLVFDYNMFHEHTRIATTLPVPPGPHVLTLEVVRTPEGGGDVTLAIDGVTAATGLVPRLLLMLSSLGMDIGRSMAPVSEDYHAPFAYGGSIAKVVFELPARRERGEVGAEVRAEMSRQ